MTMMRTQSSGSSGIGSMTDDPPLHIGKYTLPRHNSSPIEAIACPSFSNSQRRLLVFYTSNISTEPEEKPWVHKSDSI